MEDLSFCHFVGEVDKSPPFGITRRLSISISSNNVFKGTNNSHFRAIHGFGKGGPVEPFISKLCSKSRILKVLDMQDHGGVDLIQEIKMLRKIKELGLTRVRREHGNALSAAIVEMKHLENLNITTISEAEIIDLNFKSSPPQLQRLHLKARLQKLPDWIPELECLVKMIHFSH
ncbi:NBS-containing resistance-like protein [Trifolium pratense]|uniref:NBS-containing resistance-like protein n=1 Tax=Trifolium pratense TaxID=57577 RepID=A0A2K3P194_TRIPR|nr:NBS-containing resistance-like protein [Trifolium pratense]